MTPSRSVTDTQKHFSPEKLVEYAHYAIDYIWEIMSPLYCFCNDFNAPMDVLSIVISCFNEQQTLTDCVERLVSLRTDTLAIEIIIVDYCSTNASYAIATDMSRQYPDVMVEHHEHNQGKGAALSTGFKRASGEFIAIQDADLEYDSVELLKLVDLLQRDVADMVYGSRFLSGGAHRVLYFWHSMGNRFLTLLSNMMTDLNLTDMETCYKVFKRDIIKGVQI